MMNKILNAREQRAAQQKQLLKKYKKTLVCFTMNVPGEDKSTPLVQFAFSQGVASLLDDLGPLAYEKILETADGPEAYFVTSLDPERVKIIAMELEDTIPVGRLYDIDVLSPDGRKISRSSRRACFLCGGCVDECVRTGKHTVEQARRKADELLRDFAATLLAETAVDCLLEEVRLTPKPGLVDAESSGAHTDMEIALFEKSAQCLLPYFKTAVLLGLNAEDCMEQLQQAGMDAEKVMYKTTGGVNTHKGAIYTFGLILASLGSCLAFGTELFSNASLLASQGHIADEITHGSTVRMKYRRCGARHEAEEGFPNAISAYNILQETGSLHRALLWLMASVTDTNLLFRGGADGLIFVQELAKMTQELPDHELETGLRRMDQQLIQKNLSPGGSADLLALALFLQRTEFIWNEES